jgi:hypothetical protein
MGANYRAVREIGGSFCGCLGVDQLCAVVVEVIGVACDDDESVDGGGDHAVDGGAGRCGVESSHSSAMRVLIATIRLAKRACQFGEPVVQQLRLGRIAAYAAARCLGGPRRASITMT